ncbi:helix-turn-helix transcriptional regulator [Streptomyces sp. NPDC050516]|uniref:helix-turn-helix transcriptional regulator n=1 Tax=Streptomyces sp. NPDC050516 TaxID=3365621 RepID=UPI0037A7345E
MNRTERLYALVEELRAIAPRPRTVGWLATRFEVSGRTVQRDLQALMESGVPVRCEAGRRGGWFIDPGMTLPPVNLTSEEALAVAAALAGAESSTPFSSGARGAMRKLAAALSADAASSVRDLASRIHVLPGRTSAGVLRTVELAVLERRLLRIRYADAAGCESSRLVEPGGLLCAEGGWYLLAWCRLREAGRGFRLDRIRAAEPLDERCEPRPLSMLDQGLAGRVGSPVSLSSLAGERSPSPPLP